MDKSEEVVEQKGTKVTLHSNVQAKFTYDSEPANEAEEQMRANLDASLERATQRLQATLRSLLLEILTIEQDILKSNGDAKDPE